MTYAIIYTSKTGNTKALAEQIRDTLPIGSCQYCGAPTPEAIDSIEAELLFAGFWTDKGGCNAEMATFLEGLTGKRLFLFGTAGFGGTEAYFKGILERVGTHLGKENTVVGSYLCQGKMPTTVRARYEAMAETDPDRARPMLENFDRAQTHPDAADLDDLRSVVAALVGKGR